MAEVVEQVLIQVNLENNQIKTELSATKDRIADFKNQAKSAADVLKELQKNSEANAVAISNQKEKVIEINSALQAEIKNQNTLQLALTKTEQANRLEAGSLAQKRASLAAGQIAYAQYSKEQLETDEGARKFGATLAALKEDILEQADGIGSTIENVGNYKKAIREATIEAQQAQEQFKKGLISEEGATAAIKKVSNLKEELGDFNDRVAALNPEAKLKSIVQGTSAVAGGFAAAQGAAALFGADSDNLARGLLKVQSVLAISQGLDQLAKLPDALKNIKLALGIVTTATEAKTVADTTNVVAVEAGAVAQGELTVVQQAGIVTSTQLGIAMNFMLGPLGLLVIGVAAVAIAFAALSSEDYAGTIDNITKSIESENSAHKETIDSLNSLNALRVSSAENALKVAQAEGKGAEEIVKLQTEVVNAKKAALQAEVFENEAHYQELKQQRDKAQALLLKDLDEDERKKAEADEKSASDELKRIEKRNAEIQKSANDLNNELDLIAINAEESRLKIGEQVASLRIQSIKNNREREIAAEKESLLEKVRQLEKAENENGELIAAERQASLDKINAINLKFDIDAQEERNQLALLKTVEGSQSRFEAESKGIIKLRDLQLKETGLTENAKQIIRLEANQKLFALEQERIKNENDLAKAEVEAASAKQIALLNAKKSQTTDPSQQQAIEIEILKTGLDQQITAIDTAFEIKKASYEKQYSFEIQAAQSNAGAVKEITDKKNQEIALAEQQASTDKLNLITKTTTESIAIVTKGKTDELNREIFLASQRYDLVEKGTQNELDIRVDLIRKNAEKLKLEYANDAEARKNIDAKANQDILQAQSEFIAARVQGFADFTNELLNLSNLANQNDVVNDQNKLARQQKEDDKEKARLKKQLDDGIITQKQYDDAVFALDAKMQQKQAELKKEQFVRQRDADVIQSLINTALAVTRALPNIPLAAITAAFGLTQTGLIASKPIPEFYDGGYTETGNPYAISSYSNSTRILHKGPEHVSPYRMVVDPFTGPIISGLEDYRVGNASTLKNMVGFFSGGFTPGSAIVPSNVSGPVFDSFAITNAVIQGVAALPPNYISVEEFNAVASRVQVNESRATS